MSPQDSLFQNQGNRSQPSPSPSGSSTPFAAGQARESDLQAELKVAKRQISNLLIMLLVVSGTLTIYLLQQVRYDRANLALLANQEARLPEARQIISDYNQKRVPAMQNFLEQLQEYGKTHPDILPLLAKYGLVRPDPSPSETAPEETP